MIAVASAEHDELRAAVHKVLEREAPLDRSVADAASPTGYDRGLWRRLATELGAVGLSVPERWGGSGAGVLEESVVAGELGAALTCTPYLSTIALTATALLASGDDDACARHLPAMTAGERTAAAAVRGWSGAGARAEVTATPDGASWRLDGRARFVIDGHSADLLLVAAQTADGVGMFAVDGDAAGLDRRRLETLDHLRAQAELTLDGAPGTRIGAPDAWPAWARALDVATVLLAAEQSAAADAALEQTVEYTGLRVQFGRTISSFQAVKHRCADTVVGNDRARSAVSHAVWAADHDATRLPAAAAMAAVVCGPAFRHAAAENVQLHGGIGFTWEHPAHRFFRRATADATLLADRRWYEDRLLTGIGVDTARSV